jgi:hypothetical protein
MSKHDYTSKEIDLALAAFALEGGRGKPTGKVLRDAGLKVPLATLRNWAYNVHAERYQQISLEVEQQVRSRLADDYHRLARRSSELAEDVLDRIRGLFDRKDRELKEVDQKLEDAEDQLRELNALIDADQRQLAETLKIPDADALIEEILGDPGDVALDKVMVARMNSNYKRREGIVAEMQGLWRRREGLEVGFKDLAKILHEAGVMGGIATDKLNVLTGQATDRVEHSFPELQRALEAKGIRLAIGQGAPRQLPAPVIDVPVSADG